MYSIKLKGVEATLKAIKDTEANVLGVLEKEFVRFGNDTVTDAKRAAPVDEGLLRNSISHTPVKRTLRGLSLSISVNVDYAAYVEFGTRSFAARYVGSLPTEWQTFAAQYKGKGGGSFEEFVMRLTRWILRKGIGSKVAGQSKKTTAEADAYGMALSILRKGIKPHPFLVPAVDRNRDLLNTRLREKIK